MSTDGKQLEGLVAFVEQSLLPQGFEVKTNEFVFNDEGIQIAEFDIQIRGKVGTTKIEWLIECRDRPGYGPAPGSWIEQLVGRRTRFRFNKVTAVSTTGFSTGAIEFAKDQGIELREVRALSAEQFSDWLLVQNMHYVERLTMLEHASILLDKTEPLDRLEAVRKLLLNNDGNSLILRSIINGEMTSLASAFLGAVNTQQALFDRIEPNGPGEKITIRAQYTNDSDHFVLDTEIGAVRIQEIVFSGVLVVKERLIPITVTAEYRDAQSGEKISQVASFAPQEVQGIEYSIEMHHLADTGQTHMLMRRLGGHA